MNVLEIKNISPQSILVANSFRYVVPGDPVPLARARMGNRRMWDTQKEQKLFFGLQLRNQHEESKFLTGPLHLDVIFYLPIPGYKQRKTSSLSGKYHSIKPDLSNLIKFIEDAATGVLYQDDALICSITSKKIYDTTPRTEIVITRVG
jgi:Holliday junction resolvase RusA-like endonuclease